LNSDLEKIKNFIIFNKIGQLAAGITLSHIQLSPNITTIYHQIEIIVPNLIRIMITQLKFNILQAFICKVTKTMAEFFLRPLHGKMDKFRNVDEKLPIYRILLKLQH
jgi:hypothetical protein